MAVPSKSISGSPGCSGASSTSSPSSNERIRLLEEEIMKLKLELANVKSSVDFLKFEATKMKVELEETRRENHRRLVTEMPSFQLNEYATVMVPTGGIGGNTMDDDDVSQLDESMRDFVHGSNNASSNSLRRSRTRRHERVPSCASGLALLSGMNNGRAGHSPSMSDLSFSSNLLTNSLIRIFETQDGDQFMSGGSTARADEEWGSISIGAQESSARRKYFDDFLKDGP